MILQLIKMKFQHSSTCKPRTTKLVAAKQGKFNFHKFRANSKSAVQRDVIESLQKDLDKLRREEDGIKLRKALATGKPIIQETEEEKKAKFDMALRNDLEAQNVQVVEATEARIQAIRYKPGGLDSLKALSLEEIDKELEIIKKRNSYIEQHYWSK